MPFDSVPLTKTQAAISEGRPLFLSKVKSVSDGMLKTENVLKRGSDKSKLGKRIVKGKWNGFPIYALTLPERSTCPNSCIHWSDCYGNNMFRATRYVADDSLIVRLHSELTALQAKHPTGFAVRLHVLGDFFSADYVRNWEQWLEFFPALHVWGYTARHDANDAITVALTHCRETHPTRWFIRQSGNASAVSSLQALSNDIDVGINAIASGSGFICPEQTGRTDTCGSCGACWASSKAVVFMTH